MVGFSSNLKILTLEHLFGEQRQDFPRIPELES